ncbi:MAG TPA: sortase, partial [Nitrospira sp.]
MLTKRASVGLSLFNRLLVVCLVVVGLWQVGEGSWIYAKAGLAQLLLQRAWSRTLAGELAVKPWPWADTWPIARLVVLTHGIDQIVLEGAYGRTLAFGPGHVESGTPLENGGTIILTGHRDTHFGFLKQLKPGEPLMIQTVTGSWQTFTVHDREVV